MVRAVQKRFAPSDEKGGKLDPKKLVKGQQRVGNVAIKGDGDEPFEREAGIGNHDYSSHGSYSDTESREARWRKVAKKDA